MGFRSLSPFGAAQIPLLPTRHRIHAYSKACVINCNQAAHMRVPNAGFRCDLRVIFVLVGDRAYEHTGSYDTSRTPVFIAYGPSRSFSFSHCRIDCISSCFCQSCRPHLIETPSVVECWSPEDIRFFLHSTIAEHRYTRCKRKSEDDHRERRPLR